ncbi:hypothetical protein G3545_12195 [Starkeya sp. ORNL1]|uniref:hypothetical protein n=1 Tax=Starkeya sp. ORNL1 TaxID=2709380 RepID=UPI0014636210|nr:hypothetical protein [Starkeya sp. ORNL1]QJP14337.1 hypothetical protein G3545_12195 [Starkeya sp. ORNL1]
MTPTRPTQIIIHRETFEAPEVEAITGIAQVVMRDWRRRGLLKTKMVGRRGVFGALDIGYLITLRDLTAQGVAVGDAVIAAGAAAPLVETFAEIASCAKEDAPFVGLHGSRLARFLIVARDGDIVRAGRVEEWIAQRDKEGKTASCIVIDCKSLGEEIARLAPRQVVIVERRAAE